MKKIFNLIIFFVLFSSCNNAVVEDKRDTPKTGTINISVDESFKPVIEQQLMVYKSSFPNTNIIATYKSEADCLKDLQSDSTRMVIVGRGLTKEEDAYYYSKLAYHPLFAPLAMDAVTLIVSNNATDTVYSLNRIKAILNGTINKPAVVDGNNATSLVRYLKDTLLNKAAFGKNVTAAAGSEAVVKYIANHPEAVGFVSSTWIGNKLDTAQVSLTKNIKSCLVECINCPQKDTYAKPAQSTIMWRKYPLVRRLYYILKENYTGLGTGFMNFMSLERGQLIFSRANIVPVKMYFGIRSGTLKEQKQ